ncbi:uncharacterized protein LOC131620088 [Vicia villosa]|uniref:uncharacterized protein LOC131620088 n=1 Tax=Vicia villosa TaxID=3911 RepID=UPI00273C9B9C|nr:uncharacterized protein LOC131620088 [Vicia villosa]
MDFITHLLNSLGHTVIWVVCDRFTKFSHFIALPTKFSAKDLALRFSVEICRLHGVPKSIVSDRDPLFLSTFWREIFKAQGTTLKYSSAYHPETDGHRSYEQLRAFHSEDTPPSSSVIPPEFEESSEVHYDEERPNLASSLSDLQNQQRLTSSVDPLNDNDTTLSQQSSIPNSLSLDRSVALNEEGYSTKGEAKRTKEFEGGENQSTKQKKCL